MLFDSAGKIPHWDPDSEPRNAIVVRYDAGPVMRYLTFRRRWSNEYPDAELMTLREALAEAKRHAGAVEVIENYGSDREASYEP